MSFLSFFTRTLPLLFFFPSISRPAAINLSAEKLVDVIQYSRTRFAPRRWPAPATAPPSEQVACGPVAGTEFSSIFAGGGSATSAGYKFGIFRVDSVPHTSPHPTLLLSPGDSGPTGGWKMAKNEWTFASASQKKKKILLFDKTFLSLPVANFVRI